MNVSNNSTPSGKVHHQFDILEFKIPENLKKRRYQALALRLDTRKNRNICT
jgi:hypothetical protein